MSEDLPKSIKYRNYEIKPMPRKVVIENKEQWNTQFEILEHKGYATAVFNFHDKPTYDLKEDAIRHCFNAGKYVIENRPEQLMMKEDGHPSTKNTSLL